MDLHQSGRKRVDFNANFPQNHGMLTKSKASGGEDSKSKRRKLETNPLEIENIIENIFSFLDVPSIKKARQVNKLWSREGAKILLTRCYVQMPWTALMEVPSKRSKVAMDKFKAFLAHKSTDVSMIPNVTVEDFGAVKVWKSLGVLGPQVKSLKLNIIDDIDWLTQLLDPLPNLKYLWLNFKHLDKLNLQFTLMSVLTSIMSKDDYRKNNPLVISDLTLRLGSLKQLEEVEKFAEFSNIKTQELKFTSRPSFASSVPNFEARVAKIISKLLSNSKNDLKKLTLYNCENYLRLLDFPCMTSLTYIKLRFSPQIMNQFGSCKFAPSFRFSENVPKLEHMIIDYAEYGQQWLGADFFLNIFEKAGTAPSVIRLEYRDGVEDFLIDSLFQIFPNVREFRMHHYACSQRVYDSLWTRGKDLKKLDITIDLYDFYDDLPNLDSVFTGFAVETVETIHSVPYTMEQLERLRINPSILNLQDLEELTLRFYGYGQGSLKEGMLVTAVEYAFNLLPKVTQIIVDVQKCYHPTQDIMKAFDQFSQLTNLITIQ